MKIKKSVMKEIAVEEIEKVICDGCEIEIDKSTLNYEGWGQLKMDFGYPSKMDGCEFQGDFCDDCGVKLIKQFNLRKTRGL